MEMGSPLGFEDEDNHLRHEMASIPFLRSLANSLHRTLPKSIQSSIDPVLRTTSRRILARVPNRLLCREHGLSNKGLELCVLLRQTPSLQTEMPGVALVIEGRPELHPQKRLLRLPKSCT